MFSIESFGLEKPLCRICIFRTSAFPDRFFGSLSSPRVIGSGEHGVQAPLPPPEGKQMSAIEQSDFQHIHDADWRPVYYDHGLAVFGTTTQC